MRKYLDGRSMDDIAIERIRFHAPVDGSPLWVADSGGKDSCCIVDLVKRSGVPAEYHYSPTTVDPPEVVRFLKRQHPETVFEQVQQSMWSLIRCQGILPTRYARYCCREFKEYGGEGRTVVLGIRAEESNRRRKRPLFAHCGKRRRHALLRMMMAGHNSEES